MVLQTSVAAWGAVTQDTRGAVGPCRHWEALGLGAVALGLGEEGGVRPNDVCGCRKNFAIEVLGGVDDARHRQAVWDGIVGQVGCNLYFRILPAGRSSEKVDGTV